jgi:hypothetical protein
LDNIKRLIDDERHILDVYKELNALVQLKVALLEHVCGGIAGTLALRRWCLATTSTGKGLSQATLVDRGATDGATDTTVCQSIVLILLVSASVSILMLAVIDVVSAPRWCVALRNRQREDGEEAVLDIRKLLWHSWGMREAYLSAAITSNPLIGLVVNSIALELW